MDVDGAVPGHGEQLVGQDFPVGDDAEYVRREGAHELERLARPDAGRLIYVEAALEGEGLRLAGGELHAAALGLIRAA